MYETVVVAGTFETIHAGHRRLIAKALEVGDHVQLGVTSDTFARLMKGRDVKPFKERAYNLKRMLKGKLKRVEFFELNDPLGHAVTSGELDAIIVSSGTKSTAVKINAIRKQKGLRPLAIVKVDMALAEDLKPISCERILRGEIDLKGKKKEPIKVIVGTENPAKLAGVKRALFKVFRKHVVVEGRKVNSGVPEQPFEAETMKGAANRAREAFKAEKCDYGVGIESGLFSKLGKTYDFLWCAVFDGRKVSYGSSMGFRVPDELLSIVKESADLNEAFFKWTGKKDVGRKKGIIWHLSKGRLARESMVEQALLCAFVPRLGR